MLEEIKDTVLECGLKLEKAIPKVQKVVQNGATKIVEQLIAGTDEIIYCDKAQRRKEGWVVERRGEPRTIMTQIGPLSYHRTYYHNSKTDQYAYLIDPIVGVMPYMRVDTGLSKQLVRESRQVSYQLASEHSCEGLVSKQTVMNKIRSAEPVIEIPKEKRCVPELHIDADEDHVAMQDKKHKNGTIVPLVSVYEGLEKHGTRKRCKNIFHMSSYKQDADTLWEDVLTRIEQRYDLTNTKIYLHGDGAAWIAKGMEWLPPTTFVLDMYHKNKYVKQMLAGYDEEKKPQLRKDLHQALEDMDEDYFDNIVKLLTEQAPERETKIREAAIYLRSHMPDIAIRVTDPAACNGGATEPHVSHVLSTRLSSRPKGWSEETLQRFAPILANGPDVRMEGGKSISTVALNAVAELKHKLHAHKTSKVCQSSLMITRAGKRSELYKALQGLTHNHMC